MEVILRVAREILGERSGKIFENNEAWWCSAKGGKKPKWKRTGYLIKKQIN